MMSSLWNIMSEFLSTVSRKKAHWYRVFDPGDIEPSYEKIQSAFPSLATLTMMEDCHMKQLFFVMLATEFTLECSSLVLNTVPVKSGFRWIRVS